ncbi:FtsX-like permease family protein [Dactylosporangium siamense]|uniref:Membrane protein n=1 Tax=Dactylosporangium siamense TaxID=685454 RepID=A0A919UGZ2_9ACTN|nr:FtsX-like permease family protein [Dactylosporangium siamense]GIG50173.1 membrane protein [Dactylosporangium siamense]
MTAPLSGVGRPAPAAGPVHTGRLRRWAAEVGLGARLALTGGREGLLRTALTAIGVGLGVAVLLLSVSVPAMLDARSSRTAARDDDRYGSDKITPGDTTVLTLNIGTSYHGRSVRGRLVRPDGAHPVLPPGVRSLPAPGTMLVSPALRDLLASRDGALLRDRMPGTVGGTIGKAGLSGPNELVYYAVRGDLAFGQPQVQRIDGYGSHSPHEPLDPFLLMLVIVIFVVLLMPVAMFVAAATRFGGEQRDRRLAAVRLVGADGGMTRRIAAGEAVVSATLGLLVGGVVFLVGRPFVEFFEVAQLSVYGTDLRPPLPLLALLIVSVPLAALAMSLVALRRVVVEPLGVVRRATARTHRRLWWRLLTPVAGGALLAPLTGSRGDFNQWQAVAGVSLVLLGVALLLPWVFDRIVGRLGGGGALSWQMAVRRLQLSGGSSVRAVGAIAVAAAGTIALQMLFSAADATYTRDAHLDPGRAQSYTVVKVSALATATDSGALDAKLRTGGVTSVNTFRRDSAHFGASGFATMWIGDCAVLRELAELDRCADGDVFVFEHPDLAELPGQTVVMGDSDPDTERPHTEWTVPATARPAKALPGPYGDVTGVLVTTGAAPPAEPAPTFVSYVHLAPGDEDAPERLLNAAMAISPTMDVTIQRSQVRDSTFASIRRGLFAGAAVTLLLVGLSLLVGTLEQLRERRRTLAALVAFGARRSTMGWSILWQTLVPVVLGLVLAAALGLGLGALLLATVNVPFHADVSGIAIVSGIAAGVVLLVTTASLPALWRLMRPDGLRFE